VTSPNIAKDLRDMALVLPAGEATTARASTVIEGLWGGTIRETEVTRTVLVEFKTEGGRLGGELTVRKGALSMRSPLSDVSYDRTVVRFTANIGGAPRYFRGSVSGDQLTGTVHARPDASDTIGDFKLRYTR
jgi:hypothetical protein